MNVEAALRFEPQRAVLTAHAYRMLGDRTEAEDVVQDAYLRWQEAVAHQAIADDRAYLRATATRLCLDRLRSARLRRELYVGPWLPEPLLGDELEDPQAAVTLADDVSFALLLALERLTPLERAAFLLHDALDVPYAEIAQTLGRSEPAVRQLAARARTHVRENRKQHEGVSRAALRLRDALADALRADDLQALQRLLTEDVVLTTDGGGKAVAALVPLAGRDRVGRFLQGVNRKCGRLIRAVVPATINGSAGFVTFDDAGISLAFAFDVAADRIAAIYIVRNPDKLRGIAAALAAR